MMDMSLKQASRYQRQTIRMYQSDMFRDDVRDLVGNAVQRQNNYIVIATLLLAMISDPLVNRTLPEGRGEFVATTYTLCLVSALVYMVSAIICIVFANSLAAKCQLDLLTTIVRIPVEEFLEEMDAEAEESPIRTPQTASRSSQSAEVRHLAAYRSREQEWMPLQNASFLFCALGFSHLLQAYSYLMASDAYEGSSWDCWISQTLLVTTDAFLGIACMHRYPVMAIAGGIVLVVGPLSGAVAIALNTQKVSDNCIPLCLFCHLLWNVIGLVRLVMFRVEEARARLAQHADTAACRAPVCRKLRKPRGEKKASDAEQRAEPVEQGLPHSGRQHSRRSGSHRGRSESCGAGKEGPSCADPVPRISAHAKIRDGNRSISTKVLSLGSVLVILAWFASFIWTISAAARGELNAGVVASDTDNSLPSFPVIVAPWPEANEATNVDVRASNSSPDSSPRRLEAESLLLHLTPVEVQWPSRHFRPIAVTCGAGRCFVASEFLVFQLQGGKLERLHCSTDGGVEDMTVVCGLSHAGTSGPFWTSEDSKSKSFCKLLLLSKAGRLAFCAESPSSSFLDSSLSLRRIAAPPLSPSPALRLFALSSDLRLLEMEKIEETTFQPLWAIATFPGEKHQEVVAIDFASQLFYFLPRGIMQDGDDTGQSKRRFWALPTGTAGSLLGGCVEAATSNAATALLLMSGNKTDSQPQLFRSHVM